MPAFLSRTRLQRCTGTRVTSEEGTGDNGDEIFDDTDFYQQLLRDVIDSKGGSGQLMDWTASQRQKGAKKSVDTRASKGRKLRFVEFFNWS
jgi:protein AATF/BFR2